MKKESKEKPHYIGHRERLRERYAKGGLKAVTQYEVLELLLTFAITRRDVKGEAKALLGKFKGIQGILDASVEDITELDGIGKSAALLLKLVKDIGEIYLREKQLEGRVLDSPLEIVDYLKVSMGGLPNEHFRAIFLNSKNEVVAEEIISEGTVDHAVIYPRKLFENALKHKATALIIVHNHPGGVLRPSDHDIKLTKKLKTAAESLSITIFDHLIVTASGYMSFYEKGLL